MARQNCVQNYLLISCVALLSITTNSVRAQSNTTDPNNVGGGHEPGALLKRFDANHDGKLDDDEKKALHAYLEERRQARAKGADSNQK